MKEKEKERENSKLKKIIFDFGSNNGQNLSYFLEKAEIVVCVEANTILTERIKKKFEHHINNNSLFIENVCLSEIDGVKDFYISKKSEHKSTLIPPQNKENYQRITVPSMTPSNIIKKYRNKLLINEIEYIKIDVEGYEHIILDDLFKNNIYPKYLSTEVNDSIVINLILNSPYKSFKFLEGNEIGINIKKIKFLNLKQESVKIDFIKGSSGPYGEDIPRKYYAQDSVINYFLNNGLGWKDICCTLEVKEYDKRILYNKKVHQKGFSHHLTEIYPAFKRMLKQRIANIIKK